MKRSNRLVLLVGVFLAIVAFVGILLLVRQQPEVSTVPTTGTVLIATVDIPLSAEIKATDVEKKELPLDAINTGAFADPSQVVGQIARQPVAAGGQVSQATHTGGKPGELVPFSVPPGLRAIAVQVDQVTGVGTIVQTGDYVDLISGVTGDKFPVITVNPADDSVNVVSGLNSTSVKVLLQGLQVLGTLLPPAAQTTTSGDTGTGTGTDTSGNPSQPGTALNGQQQIVILAVSAQDAEVIKFAELDSSITLVLRSPKDFVDPVTNEAVTPLPNTTTGINLKTLVDTYGVVPPEVVETVTPASH
ncbi:MAG: Flp pilus assembly protein CpaB [Candidatus Limnocylindrales bacterium]